MKYNNPILPGFYPDPSLCRVDQDYYLVTSTFEYFPGVPVFHSRDIVNWRQIGHCLTRKSQLNLEGAKSSGGIYAPTIRHHEGLFHMVTTDTTGIGNFYVTATDPAGPWSEPIPVKQGGIDPSLFFDDDGRVYFTSNSLHWKDAGLYQSEINIHTGRLIGEPKFLWAGTGGKFLEAPHLYKKGEWYYLLASEGGTEFGHMITVARGRKASGPFEPCPANPILSHRGMASPIQSTGHGDLFQDHLGGWWIVFLGARHVPYPPVHHLGRETFLAPVSWSPEEWPVINQGKLVELEMEVESGIEPVAQSHPAVRAEFDQCQLEPYWNFRRNPVQGSWSLEERPGYLALRCLPASLDGVAPLAFIGRRQQHFDCTASTVLDFSPNSDFEEGGLVAIMNERYRCEVFVSMRGGQRSAVLRRRIGRLVVEVASTPVAEGPVELWIRAESDWYELGVTAADRSPFPLGYVETRHLSTEIAGGFTGVYFGLYATSNQQPSEASAYFDWFEYSPRYLTGDKPIELKPVTAIPKT